LEMPREVIRPGEGEVLDIELQEDFIRRNEELARRVREILDSHGVRAIDVMGSIGSGKTCLIERMVERLRGRYRVAMIGGDVATTIDTDRVARHGVEVVQVNTGAECHLDANLVMKALERLDLSKLDLIFIENVGNLICPAEYPLGAHVRVVVVSVTEGPYTVVKHPMIFREASVCVVNKIDLAEAMGVDPHRIAEDARRVNPSITVVLTSCRDGRGIDDLIRALGL